MVDEGAEVLCPNIVALPSCKVCETGVFIVDDNYWAMLCWENTQI
jgi:hypothetical protein